MDRNWKISVVLASFSILIFSTTLIYGPPEPRGYAPYAFAYNMGFFFPVVGISFSLAIACFISIFNIKSDIKNFKQWICIIIPFILILPVLAQVGIIFYNFIRIIFNIRH